MVVLPPPSPPPSPPLFVFSKTAGFRHESIGPGIQAIQAPRRGEQLHRDRDRGRRQFTTANLAQYQAVVFLTTTGDVLNATQQTAFESYIRGGGGYVGVHAAADTEYDWPFYGNLVGAYFASHPAIQQATRSGSRTGRTPPRRTCRRPGPAPTSGTTTRPTPLPPRTCSPPWTSRPTAAARWGRPPDHLVQPIDGGRSFYTGLGHTQESYTDPNFRAILLGGIRYAAARPRPTAGPETGYTALYNGSHPPAGRRPAGRLHQRRRHPDLVGGMGLLWYPASSSVNYSLKLDWMMPGDDNSGVFIGFPDPSSDPWSAVNNGYEIQIDATDAADRTTGAVYSFQSADIAARDAALNPPGEWNTYEIGRARRAAGGLPQRREDQRLHQHHPGISSGYIGMQNHGTGDDVVFRNIRIRTDGTPPPRRPPAGHRRRTATGHRVERRDEQRARRGRAVDGNATTRWGRAYSDPQWITVDLGAIHASPGPPQLGGRLRAGGTIQVSPNNSSWTTIYSTTTGDGGVDDLTVTGGTGTCGSTARSGR